MSYNRIAFLLLLGLAVCIQPIDAQKKEKDSRANAAYEAGEYYKAIDLFKKAFTRVNEKDKRQDIGITYCVQETNRKALCYCTFASTHCGRCRDKLLTWHLLHML